MAETKNPGDKTLSVGSKPRTLKPRTETGVVRQSFSHGRTKAVVVEKVRRRAGPGETKPVEQPVAPAPVARAPAKPAPAPAPEKPAAPAAKSGVVLRTL